MSFPSPKSDLSAPSHFAYKATASDRPNFQIAVHNVGNVWLTVTNMGLFGTGTIGSIFDPYTGMAAPSCVFPAGSNITYLYTGGFWIGATVGRDTLVSAGVDDYYTVFELWPDEAPGGEIERRSLQPSSPYYSAEAVSELDIISKYTDTVTNPAVVGTDQNDGRPHQPLGIEVTQRSYSWSYDYAQDFILFDYSIRNIGRKRLDKAYMGIYIDGDVHHTSISGDEAYGEDMCGFKRTYPTGGSCDFLDTINIAYIMDDDGDPDPQSNLWTGTSARGAAGVRVVRTPSDSLKYSFNWWATNYNAATDFGPRRVGTPADPFRDMNGILGTPLGDRNKYYVMRHEEFDYDQMYTAVDHSAEGWLRPPSNALDMATGGDARYLLSFGPFEIEPGELLPLSFAFVCGSDIHVKPDDFKNYFNPYLPDNYYNRLDFFDLAENSKWASWIYDNPNYDTDGDHYKGKYRICCSDSVVTIDTLQNPPETTIVCLKSDTVYYEGDGVPDFRGASPPLPPVLTILPRISPSHNGELAVRWNGLRSEMTRDVFSNLLDFEGYRVYISLSALQTDYELLASYDKENYNRWVWDSDHAKWTLPDPPYTLDSLRHLYGDGFQPLDYDIDHHYYYQAPDGQNFVYYFSRQDWNTSNLLDSAGIYRRFPDEPFPCTLNSDSARIHCPEALTEKGDFKYFEYEYDIKNLLPSHLYHVTVTAFDYGSPGHGLQALESNKLLNAVAEYAQNASDSVEAKDLKVIVYPNPYRADGNYRGAEGGGFEGRDQDGPPERTRAVHFMNLPHKCTIRIFSLDGDLIREINHDFPAGSLQSMHDKWDLITRNTQAVVSGIFYYSVESEFGNQLGKLVIIM